MILEDTGHSIPELFSTFDPVPLGAGTENPVVTFFRAMKTEFCDSIFGSGAPGDIEGNRPRVCLHALSIDET